MKILLTGGHGMLGSNVFYHEKAKNHEILRPNKDELNLLDAANLRSFLAKNKPELIIHCAGKVGGIKANIDNALAYTTQNAQMALNIIGIAREMGVRNFINLSSSCMYPRDIKGLLRESDILKGELEPTNEGYAIAKVLGTRLCEYISRDFGLNYKTIIACNLYGEFDKFDEINSHMIPAVITKMHAAKKAGAKSVEIWGDGSARREFMYAADFADFIFFAVENLDKIPQNINVGLGRDYSIDEYYHAIAKAVGFEGEFVHNLDKPVGMQQKLMDISHIKALGWAPKTSLEEGIAKTYEWYLKQ